MYAAAAWIADTKGTRQSYVPGGGHRTGPPGKHVVQGKAKFRIVDEQVRIFVAPPQGALASTNVSLLLFLDTVHERGRSGDGPPVGDTLGNTADSTRVPPSAAPFTPDAISLGPWLVCSCYYILTPASSSHTSAPNSPTAGPSKPTPTQASISPLSPLTPSPRPPGPPCTRPRSTLYYPSTLLASPLAPAHLHQAYPRPSLRLSADLASRRHQISGRSARGGPGRARMRSRR